MNDKRLVEPSFAMCYDTLLRRILGRCVFEVYPDRSLDEMISRVAEIEAMDVQVTFDQAADLDLEREGLEDAIDRLLASNAGYTRH